MIDVTKKETAAWKRIGILLIKTLAQQNHKVGAIISMLMRETGIVGFAWYLIIIAITSAAPVTQEKLGHEGKLYVSVRSDESKALASYIIWPGSFKFGGLGLKVHTDGSSVRFFHGSCTEEGLGS